MMHPVPKNNKRKGAKQPPPSLESLGSLATSPTTKLCQSNSTPKTVSLISQQCVLEQKHAQAATKLKKSMAKTVNTKPSPRLKKIRPREEKQIHRFYEPLVLLYTLGSERADRPPENPRMNMSSISTEDARRTFLKALAYVCDYDKGGDTVTAIGLEQTPEANVFWVASNKDPTNKIVPFLKKLLTKLTSSSTNEKTLEDIVRMCTGFATPRIRKYKSLITRELKKAGTRLTTLNESMYSFYQPSVLQTNTVPDLPVAADLLNWLKGFTTDELESHSLCRLAYEDRKSSFMRQLKDLAKEPEYKSTKDSTNFALAMLRHYIGRLSHHIRAAKTLLDGASRFPCLLQSWKVESIPAPLRASTQLPRDHMTTLEGILVRMLPKDSPELERYREDLKHMENKFQLSKRLLENYQDPNFRPRVHCEIQVLQHFHSNKLQFLEFDRFIACSKDSCYCCQLYFRYHPGNFVEPNCHNNIYLNWKAPDADRNDKPHTQRDILNKMICQIRRDALDQIAQRRPVHRWHSDLHIGITTSLLDEQPSIPSDGGSEDDSWGNMSGKCKLPNMNGRQFLTLSRFYFSK